MRIARILLGIVLITVAVLAFLGGGAMWMAMQHESTDGGFGGAVNGLSSSGPAIVVPDADAMLRADASVTGRSGTSVRIDAITSAGPAFIALAPLAAIRTYLGPAAYTQVTGVHAGFGGITVAGRPVPGKTGRIPAGAPAKQGFWTLAGHAGRLQWSPGDHRYDGLALVVMRPDAAGPVTVTATAEVRPEWLASTMWALYSVGTAIAMVAVALLIWPLRRRDIVYVVEPGQLPEVAERLGMTIQRESKPADPEPADEPEPPFAAPLPVDVLAKLDVHDGGGPHPFAALSQAARAAKTADQPAWSASTVASARVRVPPSSRSSVPPVFADPLLRPHSLRTALLLDPEPAARPEPTQTNEPGIYRVFGTPPQVTPSFLWTQADVETAGTTSTR